MDLRQIGHDARTNVLARIAEMKDDSSWNGFEWGEGVSLAEMIGTDAGAAQELLEKITYDTYKGRERVELVYTRVYGNKLSDPNLPETMKIEELNGLTGAFLQHIEGGEVTFGSTVEGEGAIAYIWAWTLGFQFTKEFIMFNKTWQTTEVAAAMGEAYNKLLNHLHLGPITTSTAYVTTGGGVQAQRDAQKAGTPQLIAFDTSIAKTLKKALKVLPRGTHILCNSFDTEDIYLAIKGDFIPVSTGAISTTPTKLNKSFNESSFIEYDGAEAKMGGKTYPYAGVEAGFCYLLVPNSSNFRELEKQDLEVNTGNADVSRLILEQIVGDTFRGVYCALGGEYGVVKIDLTA